MSKNKILFPIYLIGGLVLCLAGGISIGIVMDNSSLLNTSYVGTSIAGVASFIGIILLYMTYLSQKKELQATQKALRDQKMDSAFFSMVSMLQEIIRGMTGEKMIRKTQPFENAPTSEYREIASINGREYLYQSLYDLRIFFNENYLSKNLEMNIITGHLNRYENPLLIQTIQARDLSATINPTIAGDISIIDCKNEICNAYTRFYEYHQHNLGHYFNYLYNILSYVLDSKNGVDEEVKLRYLALLKANLSNDEMGLIFYESLTSNTQGGDMVFRDLLDSTGLLENISLQSLYLPWHHWFYPLTSFKFLTKKELEIKKIYRARFKKATVK